MPPSQNQNIPGNKSSKHQIHTLEGPCYNFIDVVMKTEFGIIQYSKVADTVGWHNGFTWDIFQIKEKKEFM